jgi:GT2 family glycosyltransferase
VLYAAVDVLAHPTTEDTFAMVVLEAMAQGLPVVVSGPAYCGISGLLTNQANAMILASPTDEHELASVLGRILKDQDLRQKLSAGARHFAAQCSWNGAALQQELIYRQIVDRRFELLELHRQPMKLTPQAIPVLSQFSIVIPSWNNLAFLKLCVDSVRSNSTFSHQIIVHVNDGSDGTLDWVRAQGLAYTHSTGNIGICLTVNQCAALAQHDLILYLNDDMYCCPQWDSKLLEKVRQIGHDAFMLSGTMIEPVDSRNPCVSVCDFGRDVETFRQSEILQKFQTQAKADWYGATWPPTLVHRRWWHAVGGYSTEFSPGMASDSDFSMKMWAAGCRVFMGIGDSLVYHFMCKSTGRIVKNNGRKQFMRKWGVTSSFFDRYYLHRGQTVTDTELAEPAKSSQFRWKSGFNKLKASFAR